MEELLRQAFQLGQQWVQDMNNDKEPTNFNEWYASDEVQEQVNNCSISAVSKSVCDHYWMNSGISLQGKSLMVCTKCRETKQTVCYHE